jgi:hypothetical protein
VGIAEELGEAAVGVDHAAGGGLRDPDGHEARVEDLGEPLLGLGDVELGLLQVVDVRAGAEPLAHRSGVVAHGHTADQPPAVDAVRAAQTAFE